MAAMCGRGGLDEEGRALVERLHGRWTGERGMCRCPAHDDRTPSLSVRVGRSRLLFHCFAGCRTGAVLDALASLGLAGQGPAAGPRVPPCRDRHGSAALRLWAAAAPTRGTPAESYLAARGLDAASCELRYHARTPIGPMPQTRFRPALIAAVRDEAGLVAVHRTLLDPSDERGPARARKCALGPLGRGAVRLGGCARRMGLAEGIETAMSASALFGMPCWATLGTERFRHVALPETAEELILFLDHDDGGRRAAALARDAFAHLAKIEVRVPRRRGFDWNDVLRASRRRAPRP